MHKKTLHVEVGCFHTCSLRVPSVPRGTNGSTLSLTSCSTLKSLTHKYALGITSFDIRAPEVCKTDS